MNLQQTLKHYYSVPIRLIAWQIAVVISLLVHLVFLGIYFRILKFPPIPQEKTIAIELISEKRPASKTLDAHKLKKENALTLPEKKQKRQATHKQISKAAQPAVWAKEKMMTSDSVLKHNQVKSTIRSETKSAAKKRVKIDWNNATKEYIWEKCDKDILREKRHNELWFKSQSIMYGKPRSYFDKQDKRAMLIEPGEAKAKNYFPKKKKTKGIGINLGKNCFLGLKYKGWGDPNRASSSILDCDF